MIRKKDLERKYQNELHANEIVLLAYYIAAEMDKNAKGQTDFKQMHAPIEINSARVKKQQDTRIEIIVGNPPYSVGQKSANDNNQNTFYPKIEARIAATYAAKTDATSWRLSFTRTKI